MTLLLFQEVLDTLNVTEGLTSPELVEEIRLWELIQKGGLTMLVLFLLFSFSVYVFVERINILRKAKQEPGTLLNKVKEAVLAGDVNRAKVACDQHQTPMAKMLISGLSHIGSSLKNIEAAIENVGRLEIYKLEKNISVLGTISGAAPMIGFFGTVIGMIKAFIAISQNEGSVSPKLLSSGIYEAMITTAGGLFVGILAYVAYNYLVRQVSDVVHNMEVTTIEFIDLLQRPN
ncbi:MotA/TolQ/ExbB proton channel family protein [Rapidithrix thailandica]|uniref:MotA/TolQ/ExbB proton channel family protein n=1 Tax=Rapidithrix thailandica TaxID=413964 RepID=A0AAW9SCS4_9BACT